MKSEKLKTEELNAVYGGSKQELDELSEFIHQVQPSYEIRNPSDIIVWLYKYSGIRFYDVNLSNTESNTYRIGNSFNYVSHRSVMNLLHMKFGFKQSC